MRTDFDKLKSNLTSLNTLVELSQKNVEIKQRDVERKASLVDVAIRLARPMSTPR